MEGNVNEQEATDPAGADGAGEANTTGHDQGPEEKEKPAASGKRQLQGKKLALKKKLWTPYSSQEKQQHELNNMKPFLCEFVNGGCSGCLFSCFVVWLLGSLIR